jgi:hypothetical protein
VTNGVTQAARRPVFLILLAFIRVAREVPCMPASIQNVKKRKARRIKNDRLQAAKKAAKAKG